MNAESSHSDGESTAAGSQGSGTRIGEFAANALRYWEPRRVLYNLVLAAVVLVHLAVARSGPAFYFSWDRLLALFVLAVLANICYCSAYVVDLFVQLSGLQDTWLRRRGLILAIGVVFAAVLAHFFSTGIFVRMHGHR